MCFTDYARPSMRLSALIDSAREDDARVVAPDEKPVEASGHEPFEPVSGKPA